MGSARPARSQTRFPFSREGGCTAFPMPQSHCARAPHPSEHSVDWGLCRAAGPGTKRLYPSLPCQWARRMAPIGAVGAAWGGLGCPESWKPFLSQSTRHYLGEKRCPELPSGGECGQVMMPRSGRGQGRAGKLQGKRKVTVRGLPEPLPGTGREDLVHEGIAQQTLRCHVSVCGPSTLVFSATQGDRPWGDGWFQFGWDPERWHERCMGSHPPHPGKFRGGLCCIPGPPAAPSHCPRRSSNESDGTES